MNKKPFDYMQFEGLVDHRPFVVPGLLGWMQSVADPVHIKFLVDFPGVEGTQGIPTGEDEMPFLFKEGDQWMQGQQKFKTLVFNFAFSAMSGFFSNEEGIGCMMRFGGKARSVFVPYAAMLALYCPKGAVGANILGYDQALSRVLLSYITPGMLIAMGAKFPGNEPPPPPEKEEQPKREEPAARPSFLTRVK